MSYALQYTAISVYVNDVGQLLTVCGCAGDIYVRLKPVREEYHGMPLTRAQRRVVEQRSYAERGYRRITAERMAL
jgi:hypothetical protein